MYTFLLDRKPKLRPHVMYLYMQCKDRERERKRERERFFNFVNVFSQLHMYHYSLEGVAPHLNTL